MDNSLWLETYYRKVAELARLIDPMKQKIKRSAKGALPYDYLCPGGPYDEQWDWDGYFMGIALASSTPVEASYLKNWCLNFIHNSSEDGFTPGVITPQGRDERLHHMKPFLAQGAYHASNCLDDFDWLLPCYDRLKTIVDYRQGHMWNKTYGLGVWYDAMESGADNNVAFPKDRGDGSDKNRVAGADLNTFIFLEYLSMVNIAKALGKHEDEISYKRKATAIQQAINRFLWSPDDETYYNLDIKTGRLIRRTTYSNFVPLWGKLAANEQGQSQIRRYLLKPEKMWGDYGIRTLSADDPDYNNRNMIKPHSNWQGPVWVIANYLYMHSLLNYGFRQEAVLIATKMIDLCLADIQRSGGMHENYHADSGEPLAADGFISWNILAPHMLEQAIL